MLCCKLSLLRLKNTDTIESIFSDPDWMKLEIDNNSKTGTFTSLWKLNITPLNKQWIKEEISGEIRKYLEMKEGIKDKNNNWGNKLNTVS